MPSPPLEAPAATPSTSAFTPSATIVPLEQSADWQQPCTFKGINSAFYAGAIGFFFGFVPGLIRQTARTWQDRSGIRWGLVVSDGWKSSQALAVVSGLYTTVHCVCHRLRMVDDGFNRGFAGCATGLALSWSGGPVAALQSCAGLGVLSYVFDFGNPGHVEPAGATTCCQPRPRPSAARTRLRVAMLRATAAEPVLPHVLALAAACNRSYFAGRGSLLPVEELGRLFAEEAEAEAVEVLDLFSTSDLFALTAASTCCTTAVDACELRVDGEAA